MRITEGRLPILGCAARVTPAWAVVAFALSGLLAPRPLRAQGAIDPNIAPRAAELERQGERPIATTLLGRYLAVAPDDGRAWFQLGRFYLLDARDWHSAGHIGDPDGLLYLDFAATALDQSLRLLVDSALVFRSMTEIERALVFVEDSGWDAARERRPRTDAPPPPAYVLELGVNLLNSCPAQGVLLTGSDLESLAVWYVSLEASLRADVVPLRPELYATDVRYRRAMARVLQVDPALPVQGALRAVAAHRPLCLAPAADSAAAPPMRWTAVRLVRVSGPSLRVDDALSFVELLKAMHDGGSAWVGETRSVYDRAAAYNSFLCGTLVPLFGDLPPPACRQ